MTSDRICTSKINYNTDQSMVEIILEVVSKVWQGLKKLLILGRLLTPQFLQFLFQCWKAPSIQHDISHNSGGKAPSRNLLQICSFANVCLIEEILQLPVF